MELVISLILLAVVLVAGGVLQVMLCLRNVKWLGFVVPGINVLLSVVASLFLGSSGKDPVVMTVVVAFLWNIPTVVNLIIRYFCQRWKNSRK